MSKDTYAGRMQDILSQNRYTYAENNPVGHSDPSGHAVKKSGIEIALDRLGSTLKTKINDATINIKKNMQEKVKEAGLPVVKSLNTYINEKKSEVQANIPILSVGYGKYDVVALQWPESISAKIEKAMCAAYDRCANAIQEAIDEGRIVKGIVYAISGTQSDRLSAEQQLANAEYIYNYLSKRGWSLEAICGLLGNINRESVYNPGVWEVQDVTSDGYGIVQWTGADEKFLSWLNKELGKNDSEDMVDLVNEMAVHSPKKLMNYQLTYLVVVKHFCNTCG